MLAGRHIVPPHKLLIVDEAHELADRVSSAAQAELTPELVERAARRARPLIDAGACRGAASRPPTRSPSGWPRRRPGRLTDGLPPRAARGVHAARRRHPAGARARSATSRPTTPTRCASSRPRPLSTTCPRPRSGCSRSPTTTSPGWRSRRSATAGARWWSRRCRWPARWPPTSTTTARWSPPRRRWRWAAGSTRWPGRSACRRRPAARPRASPRHRSPATAGSSLDVGSPFDYPQQGILYVAAHLPRPAASGLPDAAGEELLALVERARWPHPRALLLPPGRASRRPSWSGPAPTCRCCCRARSRCRCWSASSAKTGRAACSASCRCGRASTCPATPASWWSSTGCRSRAPTSRWPRPASGGGRRRRRLRLRRRSACRSPPSGWPRASAG